MLYLGGLVLFVKIRWYQSIPFTELSSDAGCQSTGNRNFSVDPFPCQWFHIHHFFWSTSLISSRYVYLANLKTSTSPRLNPGGSVTSAGWRDAIASASCNHRMVDAERGTKGSRKSECCKTEKGLMYNAGLWFEVFFGTLMCCLHLSTMILTNHAICRHELETRNILKYTWKLTWSGQLEHAMKILQLIVRLFTRRASNGILAHAAKVLLISFWSSWFPFEKNWQLKHWWNRW